MAKWVQNQQKQVSDRVQTWLSKQPPAIEVAVLTGAAALQGGVMGGFMGSVYSDMAPKPGAPGATTATATAAGMPGMPGSTNPFGSLTAPEGGQSAMFTGGPFVQARNFAVMAASNALISNVLKKKGVKEEHTQMAASFGSGAAFALLSPMPGTNRFVGAISTGLSFALLQAAFTKVMTAWGPKKPQPETNYLKTKGMLQNLGLERYEKNFKKGELNDSVLPLLTDSALKDAQIPPGPRLLILSHINQKPGSSTAAAAS
eukprot:jgi/Chlat1/5340/Chrsp35S05206